MLKKLLAEIVATFCLIFFGTGSVIVDHVYSGHVTLAGISIITGVVVSLMIIFLGAVSGAHMNPAVTLVFTLRKQLTWTEFVGYVIAQAIGALSGSFALRMLFPASTTLGETLPTLSASAAVGMEVVLTAVLLLVILICERKNISYAAWIIGGIVALDIFVGGPYSGGSMNPVRSFAPAVVNANTSLLWIYLTGPFIGAILASLLIPVKK